MRSGPTACSPPLSALSSALFYPFVSVLPSPRYLRRGRTPSRYVPAAYMVRASEDGESVHNAPSTERRSATRLGQIVGAVDLFEMVTRND